MAIMEKGRTLAAIAQEIAACSECKKGKTGLPVPGEGNPSARVMFVGMAPGREEARTGRPFVGRSGRFLDRMLASVGMKRSETYITSPIKYFPAKKSLTKMDIAHGRTHLNKQLEAISPGLVVLLGDVAAKALLPEERLSVTESHGRLIKRDGRAYLVTFHPAAAMRFPAIRKLMQGDFRRLRALLRKS